MAPRPRARNKANSNAAGVLTPVILAGGSGTRLWPLSREYHPKQFLGLMDGRSLFQETLARLNGIATVANPIVVASEAHRFLVADQARQENASLSALIIEPEGRNTAPALALAALLAARNGADPVLLAMPADHLIRDASAFRRAIKAGATLARHGRLVTFGIEPTGPETGYGYIRKSKPLENKDAGYEVESFVEKPDLPTARKYIRSGRYLWNSGIFMMRAAVWLEQLARHRPDIARACRHAIASGHADGQFFRPDADAFRASPSDSIDYAVMEQVASSGSGGLCAVVPLEAGWSDLGAWSAVWEVGDHDDQGNVVQGDVYLEGVKDSLVIARGRLVAAVGLQDAVVVETGDAVLVANRSRVQGVKQVVSKLKADQRKEQADQRRVHRPWGWYEVLDGGDGFQVKRLTINPGSALSLQKHRHRAEHWVVVKGTARVLKGKQRLLLRENQSAYVPKGSRHRLENPGKTPLEIIEVQSGSYLGEDDIQRFADDYDRHLQG
ncbi:MAG: mannose-1-phosphate guanylyltransferase/mannose-6-phosphate isomerase [SAR202 cluster bacterium]|nr:mannose-1-phosphate guanylyltransferase/mannose-6-phosphate isomerase [SAR202 cluster bacterium]